MPKYFTKEFEDEAVRLARTSWRTHCEIADDPGIGLSTLTRWIGKNRESSFTHTAGQVYSESPHSVRQYHQTA